MIRPLVVTAAGCLIVLLTTASPSAAAASRNGPQLWTYAGAGSVWFAHAGDHLYLCDHSADGYSVVVGVEYTRQSTGSRRTILSWYTGGPNQHNGCKDVNIDAVEGSYVDYQVCLGHYSDGQWVDYSTCSRFSRAEAVA